MYLVNVPDASPCTPSNQCKTCRTLIVTLFHPLLLTHVAKRSSVRNWHRKSKERQRKRRVALRQVVLCQRTFPSCFFSFSFREIFQIHLRSIVARAEGHLGSAGLILLRYASDQLMSYVALRTHFAFLFASRNARVSSNESVQPLTLTPYAKRGRQNNDKTYHVRQRRQGR